MPAPLKDNAMNRKACLPILTATIVSAMVLSCAAALASKNPQALKLEGDIAGAHDPSMIREGGTYYVFTTGKAPGGGQMAIRCSSDLTQWRFCGQVFDAVPAWIKQRSPGTRDLWAPDISYARGEYRLYYAYSLWLGPGGESILLRQHELDLIVFHAYDHVTGKPSLQISTIAWKDGWPSAALLDR